MPPFQLDVHRRRLLAIALLALITLVLVWRHSAGEAAAPPLRVAPLSPRAVARASETRLVVDVVGAVREPGLVHLASGARVADAVAAAGGLARNGERSGVNFAAPVSDGQQVVVPVRGTTAVVGVGGGGGATTGPVSLSSATAEQLDTLPGIGPVTAEKIVAYRQQHGAFRSVEELDAISGIGTARLAELKGLVVP
jgi:competence protein ComEA